jgi:hypothetical protein
MPTLVHQAIPRGFYNGIANGGALLRTHADGSQTLPPRLVERHFPRAVAFTASSAAPPVPVPKPRRHRVGLGSAWSWLGVGLELAWGRDGLAVFARDGKGPHCKLLALPLHRNTITSQPKWSMGARTLAGRCMFGCENANEL